MKSKKSILSCVARHKARTLLKALLLGLATLDRNARAQYILAPPPAPPDPTPSAIQQANEMDVFATPPPTEVEPFKWKDLTLRPHPFYQFLYADGVPVTNNVTAHTTIQTISPGALLQVGTRWSLDYSPMWTAYSDKQFANNFGQTAKLLGGTTYGDWVLGLIESYYDINAPSSTTAGQTKTQTFSSALNGAYAMNSKMSLDLALNQNYVTADQFSSYSEWSTLDWLNYQFFPRLNAAVGAGVGYDDMAASPNMTFEQFQGRVNWRATDKISFQVHGGVEVRQFLSGGASPLVNPIYDATVLYQPFKQTRISITGQEVVSASFLQDQITETTGVTAELNQRLLGKLFLDLNGGYQFVKYVNTGVPPPPAPPPPGREDNLYSVSVRLSRSFLKRGTFAVLYQISKDNSTLAGNSFTTRQVGFQVGFAY